MKLVNENEYPFLINDIMLYIEQIKEVETDISLIEIITDFCFKKDIELSIVGEAISNDVYFKSFIQKDCELHGFFKTNIKELDKW